MRQKWLKATVTLTCKCRHEIPAAWYDRYEAGHKMSCSTHGPQKIVRKGRVTR